MNKAELLVYNLLKNNPRLKKKVRDIYQRICDFIPVERTKSVYPIKVRENFFFGFHDKCPWSFNDEFLLAHRFSIPLRMPLPDDCVEIGYFSGQGYSNFHSLAVTKAWNWHQGAMLQWLGDSLNIIFNDFSQGRHIARILDLEGNLIRIIPLPIAAVDFDGKKALSYNFARLWTIHGYGYSNGIDPAGKELIPSRDGLSLIDIDSGEVHFLFSVSEITKIAPESSMRGAFHFFTHCQFSPSGRRFSFFHRWVRNNNRHWTRMITANLEGREIFIFPTSGMVSHYSWRDENSILAYARVQKEGDGYYLFKDKSGEFSVISQEDFNSDGHPSFSTDKNWIITDTYPDRFRRRYLILYNIESKRKYILASLYSPPEYVGSKLEDVIDCDFHPRWNRKGTMICFDSAHTGKRALCTINLGDLRLNEPFSI